MLEENTRKVDLNWTELIKDQGTDIFDDLIESMTELEKKKNTESVEQVLSDLRNIDLTKHKKYVEVVFDKLRSETESIEGVELTWWDKFLISKSSDTKVRNIIAIIENADRTGSEKDIAKIVNLIEKLNPDIYEYDINILEKKLRILEKRVDRKVSDSFGSILASLRTKKGLSLAKLGDLAGVSASYINRIELNQRKAPSYPIIEKLANALEVNISTLLVAAGANLEESETRSLRELVFSTNISLGENGEPLNLEKKEQLVQIVDFISEMEWKDNKHLESLDLFNLIAEYKK